MGNQKTGKLNSLQDLLAEGMLVPRRWLEARGYSGSLLKKYADSGWLVSPARGVYRRPGAPLKWQNVVASLQRLTEYSLHIGGRSALAQHGRLHFVPMRGKEAILLYGPDTLPGWVNALGLPERFEMRNDAMFGVARVAHNALGAELEAAGLTASKWGAWDWELRYSTDERAILEFLQDVPQREVVQEADALMQGLANLRPALLSRMLKACTSIKVKRLFLALAERHDHAWFKHLELKGVTLGTGKRMLVPGGVLHPKYLITLPADLDDHAR